MGRIPGSRLTGVGARLAAVATFGLLLANCSGGMSGKVDPKYGVSASARVVEPGQPVPKGGGVYRVGQPYVVAGRTYTPEENINYREEGVASFYSDDFHGRYTANGEVFDMNSISAAHPTLPMPSYVRVTNLTNKRSLIVRINDRGPYAKDRIIDLSVKSAKLLGIYGHGLGRVRVEYVGRAPLAGSDDRKLEATLREGDKPGRSPVAVASADKDYSPEVFDSRPMNRVARDVPPPQGRPYNLGEAVATSAEPPQPERGSTVELAANSRAGAVQRAELAPPSAAKSSYSQAAERLTSPVSAYAPARYDAPAGYMSGRGLY
ncbi:MAG: septal ring lytic transglycosylase RlpA family protein [Pseudolabrys sp.]|nr:septal ring lytic transglycosylase RlpA family protein [Pseudolabrys sp.]